MATKVSHSSYWMDDAIFNDDEDIVEDRGKSNLQRIIKLSAVRRSIANFVSILSGENIPVEYSSGQDSYTNGKRVVIAADDNPKNFDVMVGLALHEGSHVLLSDFGFLEYVKHTFRAYNDNRYEIEQQLLHPAVREHLEEWPAEDYSYVRNAFFEHINNIKTLMNILEDRRIDQYVYKRAKGYRPYYNAMYDKYFYTAEASRNLKFNPEWRKVTVENYINRLILAFHPDADLDALPGLRSLVRLMDLKNIDRIAPRQNEPYKEFPDVTYDDMPVLWQEANVIYGYILKFVNLAKSTEEPVQNSFGDASGAADESDMGENNESASNPDSDLPNLDGAPMDPSDMEETEVETTPRGGEGKYNESAGNRQMEKMREMLDGNVKKKRIKKAENAAVDALDKSDGKMIDISGHGLDYGEVMVTRKMTDALFDQDWFPFKYGSNWGLEDAIAAGRRMGAIIANRLEIRNDPLVTKQTRLENGRIDRRLLAQLGMDLTGVFSRTRIDTFKPAMLHLTLDASSSMQGKPWNKVVTVATALAVVASKSRDIDVVITIRGGFDIPIVSVVHDSRVNRLPHFMKFIRKVRPHGSTPEGLCFKATMDLILECADTHDVYFINFCDGEPGFHVLEGGTLSGKSRSSECYPYVGEFAVTHTRKMVQAIRDRGVRVLSYFIAGDNYYLEHAKEAFKGMYGEDATFVNVENATDVLKTLNRRLATR